MLILTLLFFCLPVFKKKNIKETYISQPVENLENNFLSIFSDLDYSENEENIITTAYNIKKEKEDKYEIDVHFPRINFDTCESINNEIVEKLGEKLIDIVENEGEYTKYTVDYVTYANDGIISLIIKCVLKEGEKPQRIMIETYNYDVSNESLITLQDVMSKNNLEIRKVQSLIDNSIRKKNTNTQELEKQGYNIYVRDLNSNMYKIENIKNFFVNDNGDLFVVFAYGNNSYTETIDVIKIN